MRVCACNLQIFTLALILFLSIFAGHADRIASGVEADWSCALKDLDAPSSVIVCWGTRPSHIVPPSDPVMDIAIGGQLGDATKEFLCAVLLTGELQCTGYLNFTTSEKYTKVGTSLYGVVCGIFANQSNYACFGNLFPEMLTTGTLPSLTSIFVGRDYVCVGGAGVWCYGAGEEPYENPLPESVDQVAVELDENSDPVNLFYRIGTNCVNYGWCSTFAAREQWICFYDDREDFDCYGGEDKYWKNNGAIAYPDYLSIGKWYLVVGGYDTSEVRGFSRWSYTLTSPQERILGVINLTVNFTKSDGQPLRINIVIPPITQLPSRLSGSITISLKNSTEILWEASSLAVSNGTTVTWTGWDAPVAGETYEIRYNGDWISAMPVVLVTPYIQVLPVFNLTFDPFGSPAYDSTWGFQLSYFSTTPEPTGNATIFIDQEFSQLITFPLTSQTFVNNSVSLIAPGRRTVEVRYSGDTVWGWKNYTFDVDVMPGEFGIDVISNASNPFTYGEVVKFSVQVDRDLTGLGYPQGFYVYSVDGITMANVTTYEAWATQLSGGNHVISCDYSGDDNWLPVTTGPKTYTVDRGTFNLVITTSPPSPSPVSGNIVFSFAPDYPFPAPSPPTGNITLVGYLDGMEVERVVNVGFADVSVVLTVAGEYTFMAQVDADENWNSATTTFIQRVDDCSDPCHQGNGCGDLIMPPLSVSIPFAPHYPHSSQIYLSPTLFYPPCMRRWNLFPVQAEYVWQVDSQNYNVRDLLLPPGSLDLGIHTVAFTVSATSSSNPSLEPLVVTQNFSFIVTRTPPLASISGGNREVDLSSSFILDGSSSKDLDNLSNLTYSWSCVPISNYGIETCPESLPPTTTVNITGNTLPTGKYKFSLNVTTDDNITTSTSIVITAVNQTVPHVTITSVGSSSTNINPQDTLRLLVDTSSLPAKTTFAWKEVGQGLDLAANPDFLGVPSLTTPSLVVLPGWLEAGLEYTFEVEVTVPGSSNPTKASLSMFVNEPPRNGTCSIDPPSGSVLESYLISCTGWTDPSSPQNNNSLTFTILSQTSSSSSTPLAATSPLSTTSVYLPLGQVNISIIISGSQHASATFHIPTTVNVSSIVFNDSTDCIISNYTKTLLSDLSDLGDSDQILQLVNLFMSMMLNDTAGIEGTCSNGSEVSDFRAELWTTFLVALNKTTNRPDISPIVANQMAQVLVVLTTSLFNASVLQSQNLTQQHNLIYLTIDVVRVIVNAVSSRQNLGEGVVLVLSQLLNVVPCDILSTVYDLIALLSQNSVAGTIPDEDVIEFLAPKLNSSTLRAYQQQTALSLAVGYLNFSFSPQSIKLNSSYINQAFLDVTVSRYDLRRCLNKSGQRIQGDTITIEISSLGQAIEVNDLSEPFQFYLPIDSGAQLKLRECSTTDYDAPSCAWWDAEAQQWQTSGCTAKGIVVLPDNSTALNCACNHLTDFSVLVQQIKGGKCVKINKLLYQIFATIYLVVFGLSFIQLLRTLLALYSPQAKRSSDGSSFSSKNNISGRRFSCPTFNAVATEHVWVCIVTLLRSLSCASTASFFEFSLVGDALVRTVPYIVMFWVFTNLAFQWATVIHFSMTRLKNDKTFMMRILFYVCNVVIAAFIATFFVAIVVKKNETLAQQVASIAVCAAYFITGTAFVVYGSLLAKQLQSVSKYEASSGTSLAARIFITSMLLSSCFIAESVIWALSVAFVIEALDAAFFALDVVALLAVLFVFFKSVQTLVNRGKGEGLTGDVRSSKASRLASPSGGKSSIRHTEVEMVQYNNEDPPHPTEESAELPTREESEGGIAGRATWSKEGSMPRPPSSAQGMRLPGPPRAPAQAPRPPSTPPPDEFA